MKKLFLFLLAVIFVAACTVAPKTTTPVISGDEEEEVAEPPEWMKEMIETHNRNMEEKKKKEKEIEEWLAQKPKERPARETVNTIECKIKKYDCWDVLKLFTPASDIKEEERNKELKKMGLEVKDYIMYRDGGSKSITLSDGTRIHVSNSLWDRSHDMTVKLTDGRTVKYDTEGYQIK